jgi:hypothetical protein
MVMSIPCGSRAQCKRKLKDLTKTSIVQPSFLPIILHLLQRTPSALSDQGLVQLLQLIRTRESKNALAFLSQRGWQSWLLPFLIEGDSGMAVIKDSEAPSFKLALTILTSLLVESLCMEQKEPDKMVHNIVGQTIEILFRQCGWSAQVASFARVIYQALFKQIRAFAAGLKFSAPLVHVWDNLFIVFNSLDDFLFYRPVKEFQYRAGTDGQLVPIMPEFGVDAAVHLDETGEFADTGLVERCLETLTALGFSLPPQGDDIEKKIKARGNVEVKFFSEVLIVFKTASLMQTDRARALHTLAGRLEDRNASLFRGKRSVDLVSNFVTAYEKHTLEFRVV